MRKALLSLVVLLLFVLAACTSESKETTENEKSTESEKPTENVKPNEQDEKKTLIIANGTDMISFDIHDHNNTSTEAIHVNMFDYLVKNNGGQFEGVLVESYENIDDNTWSFKLKEGVKFHDGSALTAEDVKFTLERVARDNTLLENGSYKQIKEVVVKSELEFDIVTENSEPALLNRLSRLGSGILPKKYIEENGWDVFLQKPVGTGPYKFKEWKKDDRITLEKNEDYFGAAPKWDEVVFRVIPEDSTRVSEVITGGVDIAVNIPPTDIQRIESTEGVSIVTSPTQRVLLLAARTAGNGPTADPKVREAIDLAIDKQTIVDALLHGMGTVTRTRVTPGNVGANESLYGVSLYDQERARELLKEAGYENGLTLTMSSPSGRYLKDKEAAELMAAMLGQVGITVELEFLEWSSFNEKYQARSFGDLFMIAYGNSMFDASLALDRLKFDKAKGETDYNNPEVEKLLVEAEKNMNLEERAQQYMKAQEMIAEDRPYIFLYQMDSVYGVNDRIQFTPNLNEMLYVDEITLK